MAGKIARTRAIPGPDGAGAGGGALFGMIGLVVLAGLAIYAFSRDSTRWGDRACKFAQASNAMLSLYFSNLFTLA